MVGETLSELFEPEVVGGVLVYIVKAAVTMTLLGLFEEEEALQAMLMAAYTGNVIGKKQYAREAAGEMKKWIGEMRIGEHGEWYAVVPFAKPAFDVFFKSAKIALETYRRI